MSRTLSLLTCFALASLAAAQGTKDEYDRANSVFKWTAGKVTSAKVEAHWTPDGGTFWYWNAQKQVVLVNVEKGTREVVTEDKLPKDAERVNPPKSKGRDAPVAYGDDA